MRKGACVLPKALVGCLALAMNYDDVLCPASFKHIDRVLWVAQVSKGVATVVSIKNNEVMTFYEKDLVLVPMGLQEVFAAQAEARRKLRKKTQKKTIPIKNPSISEADALRLHGMGVLWEEQ